MAANAAHWRDLPATFGKWTAVHARFRRWSHAGVWERLFHALADTPDFEYVLIDSTISKVHADAAGAKGLKLPASVARAGIDDQAACCCRCYRPTAANKANTRPLW
ncbi:hypothetical protein M798_15430 [Brucella melitensis ADMAS-G1]|nr:hypothetical protein M798_15430 [Brucella melitensis ADMAS-G1]